MEKYKVPKCWILSLENFQISRGFSVGSWRANIFDSINGPGIDDYVAMEIPAGQANASTYFYHADGLGSVTDMTLQSDSSVQARYEYAPFGAATVLTGSALAATNPYEYTGRRYDVESGLMYYRSRMYDPQARRFGQEDKWEGILSVQSTYTNKYQYVGGNPLNWIDPSGKRGPAPTYPYLDPIIPPRNSFGGSWMRLIGNIPSSGNIFVDACVANNNVIKKEFDFSLWKIDNPMSNKPWYPWYDNTGRYTGYSVGNQQVLTRPGAKRGPNNNPPIPPYVPPEPKPPYDPYPGGGMITTDEIDPKSF